MFSKYTTFDINRFHEKIDKSGGDDSCWNWTACLRSTGYGVFVFHGKKYGAHRVSWMIHNEKDIPDGLFVCHKCDNKTCVNPKHFFLGTALDNIRDCYSKGRKPPVIGEKHGRAKLTENDAIQILALCRQGDLSHSQIGHIYGVTSKNIQRISKRKSWKHLG